jgi:hypothetical protein
MLINGLDVMSWSEKKWLEYAAKKNFNWHDNIKNISAISLSEYA